MGKKPKREPPAAASASAARVAEPVEAKERRFQWWQLLIGAAVALAAVLIPLLWNEFKSTPQFALEKPITRPDSGIVIVAQNRAASRKAPLTIEFDGFKFADAGRLIPSSEPFCWRFTLQDHDLPDSLLRDGAHRVRVGFAGEPLSEPLLLAFSTQAPVVEAEIIQPPDKPQDRVFIGKVASPMQSPAETLAVDVVFHHEGYPQQISVPVKRVTDETGLTYFEFETNIQGLPNIASDDPRYSEPFFAFRVTDQAGNQYFQQESYAQFMAPGDKRFGVNRLADIEVQRLPVDLRGKTKLAIRLVTRPKPTTRLADGTPAIYLKVTTQLWNVNQLKWMNLPSNLRANQPIAIIYRDEGKLAIAFGNEYEDQRPPTDRETRYRVEQTVRDGQIYSSNTAKASPSFAVPVPRLNPMETERGPLDFPDAVGYVNDFAGVIDSNSEARLQALCEELERKADVELAVVTVATVGKMDYVDYVTRLFEKWEIGKKGKDNGVLLFVTVQERRVRIETGYGIERIFSNTTAGRILDVYVVSSLRRGDYGAGLLRGAEAIAGKIGEEYGVEIGNSQAPRIRSSRQK